MLADEVLYVYNDICGSHLYISESSKVCYLFCYYYYYYLQ
jgi:hypothetical protein